MEIVHTKNIRMYDFIIKHVTKTFSQYGAEYSETIHKSSKSSHQSFGTHLNEKVDK